jgi:hypothetical protein
MENIREMRNFSDRKLHEVTNLIKQIAYLDQFVKFHTNIEYENNKLILRRKLLIF